jgi:hypothetical protein
MLFVDAGNNRVGLGVSSPQHSAQILDALKISNSAQSEGSLILGDGSTTNFNVGIARWNGASNAAGAGGIGYMSQGSTNAGGHYFYTGDGVGAGSQTERVRFSPTDVVFNEASNDYDFRVESDGNTHMLFVDAGNSRIHVASSATGPSTFNVVDNMAITNTAGVQYLLMGNQDSSGANNPNLIQSANGILAFGNGNSWSSASGGTFSESFRIGANEVTANESSSDQDFRVESNGNANMLFVDAGNDAVIVGTSSHNGKFNSPMQVGSNGGLKNFAFSGTAAVDTSISINADANGMGMLMIATRNTGSATNTASAIYHLTFRFDGNNAPVSALINGTDFMTFGVSGSNTLTVQNSDGGNVGLFMMMAG